MLLVEWFWERRDFVPICQFAALLAVMLFGLWAVVRRSKNRLRRQFADRPVLGREEFCRQYYASLHAWHDGLWDLWSKIGRETGVPCGQLRPDDRLSAFAADAFVNIIEKTTFEAESAWIELGLPGKRWNPALRTLDDCLRVRLAAQHPGDAATILGDSQRDRG